jgi:phage shock protein A
VLSQRRSLAEEAQALKVHRDRIEAQLQQAQDELAATRGSVQELTERLQESESEST